MRKNILLIVVGMCVAFIVMYAWWFYGTVKIIEQDHATLNSVVDFINKQIQANTPPTVGGHGVVNAPAQK